MRTAVLAALLALYAGLACAQTPSYQNRKEVKEFVAEMVKKHGFKQKELARVLAQAQFQPAIVRAMDQPPESVLGSWQAYRAIFIRPERIQAGAEFWNRNAEALKRAATEFGVQEDVIIGIIGVETTFGRNIGTYRVIDALATLAFDYPKRASYFRGELEHYLVFVRDQGIDPLRVKGSYAGAIGIPQFMPGSYRRFAVDFDGDGQINLATSAADAIQHRQLPEVARLGARPAGRLQRRNLRRRLAQARRGRHRARDPLCGPTVVRTQDRRRFARRYPVRTDRARDAGGALGCARDPAELLRAHAL